VFIRNEHSVQMNNSGILIKAMEATSPPLSWKVIERERLSSPGDADAILALRIREGPAPRFAVEVKTVVRIDTLRAQAARSSTISRHPSWLVVVPYMSKTNAALCQ